MLYVAIGRKRNDNGESMYDALWYRFQEEVIATVDSWEKIGRPDTVAYGQSHWGEDSEETCVMVWFDELADIKQGTWHGLTVCASMYWQDAIAWSVSNVMFAKSGE